MRVLGTSVLAMESLVMGFALLLAMDSHGALALSLGGALAIAFLLNAGIMKRKAGWVIGSALQVALISYGSVVAAMYSLGILFAGLWVAAYVIGKKGEALRAGLLAERARIQDSPVKDQDPKAEEGSKIQPE
jgi:hypothetical protein